MYELNRLLLQSIGPKGARYEDVLLDFRDQGTDPARASILFLENGGGKSVLLKLLFTVVLAGRKYVLGANSTTKTLENFVLSGDIGHVVLEWRRVDTDGRALHELLLTGKAYEWRNLQRSSDSQNLREEWWTLRPREGLITLETLPTRSEGRRRRLTSFKEQLEAAHRDHPELELVWTDVQHKWNDHLDALGLDPELFKYQRDMNAAEGDADELFAFRTHEAFIDFLLKAVTDREGPTELASNVDLYSEKLRDRERLQLEETFVEGALERLEPLARAARRREEAKRRLHDAQRQGEDAHCRLVLAAQRAAREHERLLERADVEDARARTLDTRVRELQAQLSELRRCAAQFRLGAAQASLAAAEDAHRQAHLTLDAWRASDSLGAHLAATATTKRLAAALADAECEAAPLIERRTAAARRYAGALLGLAEMTRAEAEQADSDAERDRKDANEHDNAAREEIAKAARLRAEVRAAQQRLDATDTERARLVEAKLLAREQTPEEVLAELEVREVQAERRERDASTRIATIDTRRRELGDLAAAATVEAQRVSDSADISEREHETLRLRGERLTGNQRLHEIAGVEDVQLWRMAEPLRLALAEAVAVDERKLVMLELDAAEDRHALRALERSGRLPAVRDAQHAIDALRGSGVPAVTGWDYLSESVPAHRREALLGRLPELVGGVVLTNRTDRERAQEALAKADLHPTTVVALGDSVELDAAALDDGDERFVVAPNPALYDEDAGEEERQVRAARLELIAERRRELDRVHGEAQQLRQEFEVFLRECPEGHLESLAVTVAGQREVAVAALARRETAEREAQSLDAERPTHVGAVTEANRDLQTIEGTRPRLEALRERVASERDLREAMRRASEDVSEADLAGDRHAQRARALRVAAEELVRLADDKRRERDRRSEELGGVEGVGHDAPRESNERPLEELRGDYELATRLLRQATTDSELAAEHRRSEQEEARTRGALEDHSEEARRRAERLLTEATDRTARREGERRAQRVADGADTELVRARTDHELRKAELDSETPRDEPGRRPRAQLTGELVPSDLDHALELHRRLDTERARTLEGQRAAADTERRSRERAVKAASRAEVLSMSAESVLGVLQSTGCQLDPERTAAGPAFAGTSDEARVLVRETNQSLSSTDAQLTDAEEEVREAAERVSRYALDDAFETMAGNLRDRLGRSDGAQLARDAAGLIPHLQARVQEVARELASIEQHRAVLIQRLLALVQAGLSVLREAGRASRLPSELEDWSGKQFLHIDFDIPDSEDVLLERLGEVLDGTVGDVSERDGMTMLLHGVRAAAQPSGFRVTILKPNTVLRDERVNITAMGEFSGGQRLTAAIALYCTLATLRTSTRGRRKRRAGVLFLDNPIGTANAAYLLEIQLKVAERVGVQLVYTTGVFDTDALSKFPCVLRLRNDLDMRAGMQHIRVSEPLRQVLTNGHRSDDDAGYLDVARVIHQSDETSSG